MRAHNTRTASTHTVKRVFFFFFLTADSDNKLVKATKVRSTGRGARRRWGEGQAGARAEVKG